MAGCACCNIATSRHCFPTCSSIDGRVCGGHGGRLDGCKKWKGMNLSIRSSVRGLRSWAKLHILSTDGILGDSMSERIIRKDGVAIRILTFFLFRAHNVLRSCSYHVVTPKQRHSQVEQIAELRIEPQSSMEYATWNLTECNARFEG